jgi:hypothetical protein
LSYDSFIYDSSIVTNNLVYNFGLIYNNFKNIVLFFDGNPSAAVDDAYEVGYAMGSIFYYLLVEEIYY